MGKSIWPVISKFSYKDKYVDFKCNILIRKFEFNKLFCSNHFEISEGKAKRYVQCADGKCPVCKSELKSKVAPFYCLYIAGAPKSNMVDIVSILNKYTAFRWSSAHFRFGNNVRSYSPSRAMAIDGLNWINNYRKEKEKAKIKDKDYEKDVVVSMVMNTVTDEMIEESYKIYKKNQLLRKI